MVYPKYPGITVNDLRNVFWGHQDLSFKAVQDSNDRFRPKPGKVLETKTVTLPIEKHISYYLYNAGKDTHTPNVAYTNLKFQSTKSVHHVALEVGWQEYNKCQLFNYVENIPIIDHLTAPNCIPQMGWDSLRITIEFNEPVPNDTITFSYDIVEIENPSEKNYYEYLVNTEQFGGDKILDNKTDHHIKLSFNHPIVRLYAFLPENVVDARLILNGYDYDLVFTKEKGTNYHVLEFGDNTPLNFSRIDLVKLWFTTESPNPEFPVRVHAIAKQLIRCLSGMTGLGFSK